MEQTIKREIKEELGVEIELLKHLPSVDHILPSENQHWVTSAFVSKIVKGMPKIMEPGKCDAIGWFGVKELDHMEDNLTQPTKKYLSMLKNLDIHNI
jgi:ADP-ribose pyrophosphatase YjhB (NUDIX family)